MALVVAVFRVFRVMTAVGLRVMLARVFMVLMGVGCMAMGKLSVVGRLVVVTCLMVGVCLTMMLGSCFVVKRGVMMVVVFSHSFLGFRGLTKVPVLRAIDK